MPFLIIANGDALKSSDEVIQKLFSQPGSSWDDINKDIPRALFIGSSEQAELFKNAWQNKDEPQQQDKTKRLTNSTYYVQGNMTAANIYLYFNHTTRNSKGELMHWQALQKEDEPIDVILQKRQEFYFAYVNSKQELCGCSVYFRKDNPNEWIIGLVKNTNLTPADKQIYIMTSFDPKPFLQMGIGVEIVEEVNVKDNELIDDLNASWLKKFFQQHVFLPANNNTINPKCLLIEYFSQFIPEDTKNMSLFAPLLKRFKQNMDVALANPVLAKLQMLKFGSIDLDQLIKCFDVDSDLYKLIELLEVKDNITHDERMHLIQQINFLFRVDKSRLCQKWSRLSKVEQRPTVDLNLHSNNGKEMLFMQAALEVDKTCRLIKEQLAKKDERKYKKFAAVEEKYRQKVHELVFSYLYLNHPRTIEEFTDQLKEAGKLVTRVVEVDRHPWVRTAIKLLVNTLTLIFTAGIANIIHRQKTGLYLFYGTTRSSEKILTLTQNLKKELEEYGINGLEGLKVNNNDCSKERVSEEESSSGPGSVEIIAY